MELQIKSFDSIVIGGGCIGCAIALRLADRGLTVGLLERGKLNGLASAAAVGGLNYLSDDLAGTALLEFTARCADEFEEYLSKLTEQTGLGIDYFEDDLLQVAFTPSEMDKLDAELEHLKSSKKVRDRFERLSSKALLDLAPYLSEDLVGGYRLSEPQVEVPHLLSALNLAVRTHPKIDLVEGFEVASLRELGASVEVVGAKTSSTEYTAKTAILAAGGMSAKLLGMDGQFAMKEVKGQVYRLAGGEALDRYQGRPFPFHIYSHPEDDTDDNGRIYGSYIVPRRNGEVVAGVTYEEYAGNDNTVYDDVEKRMMAINERVVPALSEMYVVDRWEGKRPKLSLCGSREKEELCLPIVGQITPDSNIVIATGHLGLGITMSDGTAKLVERLLMNECGDEDLRALDVMRPRLEAGNGDEAQG